MSDLGHCHGSVLCPPVLGVSSAQRPVPPCRTPSLWLHALPAHARRPCSLLSARSHLTLCSLLSALLHCPCPGADCEGNIDECLPQPCLNGATCVDGIAEFTCRCLPGYEGETCQVSQNLSGITLPRYSRTYQVSLNLPCITESDRYHRTDQLSQNLPGITEPNRYHRT